MADAGIILCDEYTQERSIESVHAVVAGAAASDGGPARRRGAAAGRGAGGGDTALGQGWAAGGRLRCVPPALIEVVHRCVQTGTEVEAVVAEISAINAELLARRELT